MRKLAAILFVAGALIGIGTMTAGASDDHRAVRQVTVPTEDRFLPFALTVHVGDVVKWVNNDGDDHSVVSDDAFNTAGHQGENDILQANGGTVKLRFTHPGTFVYYCRFHAHLDQFNQPVAPGPEGGIVTGGNYGTPMSGSITVLSGNND